eukprot:TRINITY_DN7312_c0_g1_i8.p1 TRINITY_DN7312_c0_g1~~TRINITY_DN7312_c0_g1_i8.p1  ORF type:complete len:400 (-),score=74.94 TRINITY_DN7312_c0_g1_i8:61-1260(-)
METKNDPDLNLVSMSSLIQEERKSMRFKPNDERLTEYLQNLQMARYEDFSCFDSKSIFVDFGTDASGCRNVGWFGLNFPQSSFNEKLYLFFIKTMDKIVDDRYNLIYFNSGVSSLSKSQVAFLREVFQSLPEKYHAQLETFYIMHPSFLLQIYVFFLRSFSWGPNLLTKAQYVWNTDILKTTASWRSSVPANVLEFLNDESMGRQSSLGQKRRKVFGINLNEYPMAEEVGVPKVLVVLASYFERYPDALKSENIFRIPGSKSEEEEIEDALSRDDFERVFSVKDPNVVAGLFKRVFREMPDPLFPSEHYESIKGFAKLTQDEKDGVTLAMIDAMPPSNRRVFKFLVDLFLKVLTLKKYNRMETYSLSVVFAPNIMRPKKYEQADILNAKNPIALSLIHI